MRLIALIDTFDFTRKKKAHTMKTTAKPAKPVAALSPARPGKPGKPVAVAPVAAPPARPGKPVTKAAPSPAARIGAQLVQAMASAETPVKRGPGRPPKAPVAAAAPVAVAASLAHRADVANAAKEIEALKATIQAQTEAIAKLRAKPTNTRTISEIVEGAALPKGDPRSQYHGVQMNVKRFTFGKNDAIVLHEGEAPVLLALPRDNDVGGNGAQARNGEYLAVHSNLSEDGETYTGAPTYITLDQLGEIWPE